MIDVLSCIQEFYCLQLLEAEKHTEQFKKSHEKWESDFFRYKEQYEKQFAAMLHDYLFLICGGEARHAYRYCASIISNLPISRNRHSTYQGMRAFDPAKSADKLVSLFEQPWRQESDGYGGEPWRKIAEALTMFYNPKYSSSLVSLIDHCIDLSHNNGTIFDKSSADIFSLFYGFGTRKFLNHKRDTRHFSTFVIYDEQFMLSHKFLDLFDRATILGIISNIKFPSLLITDFNFMYNYSPIKWGTRVVSNPIKNENHEEYVTCDYCDEEYSEDDLTCVSNGDKVCSYCLEHYYSYCEDCGCFIKSGDEFSFEGEWDKPYCEVCYAKHVKKQQDEENKADAA
jgi:hypothetical protein